MKMRSIFVLSFIAFFSPLAVMAGDTHVAADKILCGKWKEKKLAEIAQQPSVYRVPASQAKGKISGSVR